MLQRLSNINQLQTRLGLFFLTTLGLIYLFGPVLIHPNTHYLSFVGDGLKSYYGAEYFLRYGSGSWHNGFNYPDGNHLIYLDMNPLITWILKGVQPMIDLSDFTVGIINYVIILSFFPAVYLIFNLLKRSLLPTGYAAIFSLIITFLAPQIMRISGHFSLAFVFFIPLIWTFLLNAFENIQRSRNLLFYFLTVLLAGFAHPYYTFLGAGFMVAYTGVYAIQYSSQFKSQIRFFIMALVAGIGPGFMLKLWEIFTFHGADDFVKYPYGFLSYIAGFESIFLPMQGPIQEILEQIVRIRHMEMEGYAYVGVVGLFLLIFTLIRIASLMRKRKSQQLIFPVLPATLQTSIWAASLLLIPAMAYPFQWFPDLADSLGIIRQFRSLGRLAWIFYYVYMVYSAFLIHALFRVLRQKKMQKWAWILVVGCIALYGFDSFVLLNSQKNKLEIYQKDDFEENEIDFRNLLIENGRDVSDFQAILSVPFFHIGSEKLFAHHTRGNQFATTVSLHTGLPLLNNMAARAPLSHSLDVFQLVSHPFIEKVLPTKLPNSKPLLLLYTKAKHSPGTSALINKSEFMFTVGKFYCSKLNLTAFESTKDLMRKKLKKVKPKLKAGKHFFTDKKTKAICLNTFGDEAFPIGKKAMHSDDNQPLILVDTTLATQWKNVPMEVSWWVKLDDQSSYLPLAQVFQYHQDSLVEKIDHKTLHSVDVDRGWARISIPIVLFHPNNRLVIRTQGSNLTIDNLLIRPKAINVYDFPKSDSVIFFNNYFL